jgi:hypothetical protein
VQLRQFVRGVFDFRAQRDQFLFAGRTHALFGGQGLFELHLEVVFGSDPLGELGVGELLRLEALLGLGARRFDLLQARLERGLALLKAFDGGCRFLLFLAKGDGGLRLRVQPLADVVHLLVDGRQRRGHIVALAGQHLHLFLQAVDDDLCLGFRLRHGRVGLECCLSRQTVDERRHLRGRVDANRRDRFLELLERRGDQRLDRLNLTHRLLGLPGEQAFNQRGGVGRSQFSHLHGWSRGSTELSVDSGGHVARAVPAEVYLCNVNGWVRFSTPAAHSGTNIRRVPMSISESDITNL